MTAEHVSLREYIESLFHSHERRHEEMESHRIELRDLLKQALDETRHALAEYKTTSNEWRATLNDVITLRPDRKEVEAMVSRVEVTIATALSEISSIETTLLRQEGERSKSTDIRVTALAFMGLAIMIGGLVVSAILAFR